MRLKIYCSIGLLTIFLLGISPLIIWFCFSPILMESDTYALPLAYAQSLVVSEGTARANQAKSDMSGCYYLVGKSPRGLRNVWLLYLQTKEFELNDDGYTLRGRPISPHGYIYTDSLGGGVMMSNLEIVAHKISFVTEPDLGISYKFAGEIFTGRFPVSGYSEYFMAETILIKGRLTKSFSGLEVVEGEMNFTQNGCPGD